jgi:hypothetical protein
LQKQATHFTIGQFRQRHTRMKTNICSCGVAAVFAWASSFCVDNAYTQGTAFTYQGQLINNGLPANGNYDLTFTLFAQSQNGVAISPILTNLNTPVTAGLFSATVDFGTVFNGSSNWLEIGVRTNGNGDFITLGPRQLLTPTPYAIFAANASNAVTAASAASVPASGIVGTISSSNLSAAIVWQTPSATTLQAQPNVNYLLTNSQQVSITLPASPNIGDVVEVAGVGGGGWVLAQNPGQTIIASFTPLILAGDLISFWASIASSSDGTKLAAASSYGIWTSGNSGTSWSQTTAPTNTAWSSIASSSDGTKLTAAVKKGGIWISTNSGSNWTQTSATNETWSSVASSSDGTKLAVVASFYPGEFSPSIWTSSNSGTDWVQTSAPTNESWVAIASSSDGTKLAAAVNNTQFGQSGAIWISGNSGTNWTQSSAPTNLAWVSVASSSDGTKFVAASQWNGIWTSSNSGSNWLQTSAPGVGWSSIASSSDGTRWAAVANVSEEGEPSNMGIWISNDSGSNWVETIARNVDWNSIASSSDGTKLAAVISGSGIWTVLNDGIVTSQTASLSGSTVPGTAGYLQGNPGAIVRLIYAGNGQFIAVYQTGLVSGH